MQAIVGLLRTFCGFSYAVLFLIFTIPVLGIEYFIGKKDQYKEDISSLRIVQWGFRCVYKVCGIKITILGLENVPTDRPVLYVANHNSYFDIIISYSLCENLTGYIAKSSIEKVPSLNMWMRRLYCLFIDRDDLRQSMKVIQQAIDYVNKGISIAIFPEGTRGDSEEMLPFKSASFRIAEKTGCPVIPLAISNTRHILGDRWPCVTPTHVILQYGDPIYTDQLSREEKKALCRTAQSRIQEMLDQASEGRIPTEAGSGLSSAAD